MSTPARCFLKVQTVNGRSRCAFLFQCMCVETEKMQVHVYIYLSDLELIGDTGGEVGAGVSASSSSSSPHSSSLSGVMLLPSHTEWIETWRER